MDSHDLQTRNLLGKILTWLLSVLMSLGCVLGCIVLYQSTSIFGNMFKGLGVELPLATKFLIASYTWLYPLLFGGAAMVLIVKEFVVRDTRRRLAVTGFTFLVLMSSLGLVHYVLYLPLFDLVQKLSQAK